MPFDLHLHRVPRSLRRVDFIAVLAINFSFHGSDFGFEFVRCLADPLIKRVIAIAGNLGLEDAVKLARMQGFERIKLDRALAMLGFEPTLSLSDSLIGTRGNR